MPNIIVKVPFGVFDAAARACLVEGINAAAAQAERIPDDPKKQALCWVVIEEVEAGHWTCGGIDVMATRIPIFVVVNLPAGVLDDSDRARYVDGVHRAMSAALAGDKRAIVTSCILNEIADGTWGVNGRMWHLRDFAKHAGFEHLQHLVKQAA